MWTVARAMEATGAQLMSGARKGRIRGISTDTRSLLAGELFIALTGERFDGHQFVAQALEKGARACLVSRDVPGVRPDQNVSIIRVKDTAHALWDLARAHRARLEVPVVAITGTCGKSTTKELAARALGDPQEVLSSPASYNNRIGLPLSILSLRKRHRFAVLEIGSNAPGEVERLSRLARPTLAIITHVGAGHLEGLEDESGVLNEKLGIVKGLDPGGALILDGDDETLVKAARLRGHEPVLCGLGSPCHFRSHSLELTPDGSRFGLLQTPPFGRNPREECRVRSRLLGEHNVRNALMAIAVSEFFRVPLEACLQRIEGMEPLRGRLFPVRAGDKIILDDTYNANPSSVRCALATLAAWPLRGRRVVILGDMLELGRVSERWHRQVGAWVARIRPGLVVTCGDQARYIQAGAQEAGQMTWRSLHFESSQSCAAKIRGVVGVDDLILVKGSRNMRMERIVQRLQEKAIPHALSSPLSVK